MPQNLKIFEWLIYSSVVVDAVSTLLGRPDWGDIAAFMVVALIVVALTWAAARRGASWAAWLLVILGLLGVAIVISELWVGGPAWLRQFRPDKPLSPIEKALDVVSAVLLVAALCFYFFGGGASKDRAKT
jgi:bacteriorhodopsin